MPPVALPGIRHGHRIEALADGYLCMGGFARRAGNDRGARRTSFLPAGEQQWQAREPLNYGHAFFASARIGETVYAIGEAVERYDAMNDKWHVVVPPGRLPRSHFGAATIGHKIFVLGGFPKVGTGFSIVDVRTGSVIEAAPPPSFAHGDHLHFVCELHQELHVFGGIDGEDSSMHTSHWVRRNDAWHALPDCPEGLWTKFAALMPHNGKLYLFGDFGGWCYDPQKQTWQRRASMPHILAMPATVATTYSIWVVGGMQVKRRSNVLWRHDLANDQWYVQPAAQPR